MEREIVCLKSRKKSICTVKKHFQNRERNLLLLLLLLIIAIITYFDSLAFIKSACKIVGKVLSFKLFLPSPKSTFTIVQFTTWEEKTIFFSNPKFMLPPPN